jgi:hypothetical protein
MEYPMNAKEYKDFVIKLCEKTNNPLAPIILHKFENDVEKMASLVLVPLCKEDKTNTLSERLLKDFSNEELKTVSSDPNFLLALLAIVKESTIMFTTKPLCLEK